MRKKIINSKSIFCMLLVGSLLGASNVYSQSLNLENVTKQGFKGLQPLDNNGYYIQYYEGAKKDEKGKKVIMHLYTLTNSLAVASDFKLEMLPFDKIEDLSFNGGAYFIIYRNSPKQTRTYKMLDKEGKELASKVTEVTKARLLNKPANILPAGKSDFIVIDFTKEDKVGYSIEKFNNKLESSFKTIQEPEKARLTPVDYFIEDNKLQVLEFLNRDFSDYFEYYVSGFDLQSGKSLTKTYLTSDDGKNFGYPSFIRPGKNGGVITGGMFFDNPREQMTNSDGFFSSFIPAQGKPVSTYMSWKSVSDKVSDGKTSAMWGGKNKTLMHDIALNNDGTYVLIGENFRRGDEKLAGEKSKNAFAVAGKLLNDDGDSKEAVTAAEFVLIDFDESGNYKGIRSIDKHNSITVINATSDPDNKPYIGQAKGMNLANILNNYGYFPYRFIADKDGEKYIVYYIKHEKAPQEWVYFTPLKATISQATSVDITGSELKFLLETKAKLTNSFGLGGAMAKLNKLSKATGSDQSEENEFELKGSQSPHDFRAKKFNTRIFPSNISGKVLVYDFVPQVDEKEKKGWLSKMMENVNGSMRIYYVDIPSKQ